MAASQPNQGTPASQPDSAAEPQPRQPLRAWIVGQMARDVEWVKAIHDIAHEFMENETAEAEFADDDDQPPEPPAFKCPKCGGTKHTEHWFGPTMKLACLSPGCDWQGYWPEVEAAKGRGADGEEFTPHVRRSLGYVAACWSPEEPIEASGGRGVTVRVGKQTGKLTGCSVEVPDASDKQSDLAATRAALENAEANARQFERELTTLRNLTEGMGQLESDLAATRAAMTAALTFVGEVRDALCSTESAARIEQALAKFDNQHPAHDPLRATETK